MIDFRDLFQYVKKEREALIDALEHLTHSEFTQDVGLSFGSIKNVFAHTVMVEDIWLHYRIAGLEASPPQILEDFTTLGNITDALSRNFMGRLPANIIVIKNDAAGVGEQQSHDSPEQGRLAHPVAPH